MFLRGGLVQVDKNEAVCFCCLKHGGGAMLIFVESGEAETGSAGEQPGEE